MSPLGHRINYTNKLLFNIKQNDIILYPLFLKKITGKSFLQNLAWENFDVKTCHSAKCYERDYPFVENLQSLVRAEKFCLKSVRRKMTFSFG